MLALSLSSLSVAIAAIYLSNRIEDDVFKAAMALTAMAFLLLNLICAPWLLKIVGIAIPFVFSSLTRWSVENFKL